MVPPPTRSGTARATKAAAPDKADAILEAALDAFVARGFHGTTVPVIAERAGVGAGTIYRYFASKEAVVNELFRRHKAELARRMLDRFPMEAPARDQFRELWYRMVAFVEEQPKAFSFLELHHHADYLDDRSRAMEQRMTDFGVSFIQRAQARHELKPISPLLLIGVVLGAFTGVVRKAWEYDFPLDAETWAHAEQCAWEAIRI